LAGVSTIPKIVKETCNVLWKVLKPLEIAESTSKDWLNTANGYYEKTQFPNTVGVVLVRIFICILSVLRLDL